MRDELIQASALQFKAHIERHRMNVENLLNNPAGVAEHPDIMETIEKEIDVMSEYNDKLEILEKFFPLNKINNKNLGVEFSALSGRDVEFYSSMIFSIEVKKGKKFNIFDLHKSNWVH